MLKKTSLLLSGIKVKKQLYLIFFAAIFIPVTCIGGYLVYNSRSLLFQHYEEQAYSDNLRVKSLLLDLTTDIYNKAESLGSDEELISLLSTNYNTYEEGIQALEHYSGFYKLLAHDASVESVSVFTMNTTLPEGKYVHQITDEMHEKKWFQRACSSVTPFWSGNMESDDFGNEEFCLALHTRIFLPQIHSFAILKITVSNNHIKNRIENSSLDTTLWLNDEAIFYCSDKQLIDTTLSKYAPVQNGYYLGRIKLKERNAIVCAAALPTAYSDDIFYAASLNYDGFSYMNKITGIYLTILFLILFLASMFICFYSQYFSRRIITLRETMHNASRGNYNICDTFKGEDEISDVFADLNVMIQDILRKEVSVYEAQIRTQELTNRQQQMEFKMLTSQINPHFLYNTLETIRMRSLRAGNCEVADAVKLLGKSMRYVLENTATSYTTLDKELDYIVTYLSIQKLRFYDRINYSLKAPEQLDLSEYQILSLLLQPIVENAILHGLEEVEEHGRIIIHIAIKEKRLLIHIFDNGCGMTKEETALMADNIYNHTKGSSKSIGLYNIRQRIQLCYGSDYGLNIRSKKNFGTLVTLILPAQQYNKEN